MRTGRRVQILVDVIYERSLPDVSLEVLLGVESLVALVAVVVELVGVALGPPVAALVQRPVLVVNHLPARRAHLPRGVVLPESTNCAP